MILEINDLLGLADQGGGVAGQEIFAVADAQHQRAAQPGADHEIGILRANHRQAVSALEHRQHLAHRLDQVAVEVAGD